MKYEVSLHRNESKEVTIEAVDRDDALRKAREQNPTFTADLVVDQWGGEHEPDSTCENCDKTIWATERSVMTADDVTLCVECHEALARKGAQ